MIILCAVLELLKRPLFLIIYPVAYAMRRRLRARPYGWRRLLWYALDDSILQDGGEDYCLTPAKMSKLVERLPAGKLKEFFRAWYWSAWRNNSINLMIQQELHVGCINAVIFYAGFFGKSKYELRRFDHIKFYLPYLELWFGAYRFQAGFISCGRWQIQFRKLGA